MSWARFIGAAVTLGVFALLTIGCATRQYPSTNAAEAAGPPMTMGVQGNTEYLQFGRPYTPPQYGQVQPGEVGLEPSGMEAGRAQRRYRRDFNPYAEPGTVNAPAQGKQTPGPRMNEELQPEQEQNYYRNE